VLHPRKPLAGSCAGPVHFHSDKTLREINRSDRFIGYNMYTVRNPCSIEAYSRRFASDEHYDLKSCMTSDSLHFFCFKERSVESTTNQKMYT